MTRTLRSLPTMSGVEESLLARWPETKIEPSLDRIARLMELLGHPQRRFRSVHVTGTNGKTSTARMVESLLAAAALRTGRLTSPHLTTLRERIALDRDVIDVPEFLAAYAAVAAPAGLVDAEQPHPLSFFEMTVAMAYQAFAAAAVEVGVVEVGMGGRWDATNVIDAEVAVVLPIDLDHTEYLGPTIGAIAAEKAGIIKAGSVAVSARQSPEAAAVLAARADAVGARLLVADDDFALLGRVVSATGQILTIRGLHRRYDAVPLPLRGHHQAENAAVALAATEAMLGRALTDAEVATGLGGVASPGRFEVRPGRPTVVLDAAHNPHGARSLVASLAEMEGSRDRRVIAVVAALGDKDVDGMLTELEPAVDLVVCAGNSSPRSLSSAALADRAAGILGAARVRRASNVATAITVARALAGVPVDGADPDEAVVLVTGSVVTVGDAARVLPVAPAPRTSPDRPVGQPLPG